MSTGYSRKAATRQKQLSIILAADVYGYSRLMAEDEEGTLDKLERARAFTDKLIADHGGRIANTAGDSIIAIFETASAAVNCSVDIQKGLRHANRQIPSGKRLLFRIGLHIGEIFSQGIDVLGEGVNIAARLEAQAEPGSIVMSEPLYEIAKGAIKDRQLKTFSRGPLKLKNISSPVTAFEVMSSNTGWPIATRDENDQQELKRRKRLAAIVLGGSILAAFLMALIMTVSLTSIFK